jgi:hypothetical protein
MNLLEVIFSLHGLKSGDRRRRLVGWGIDVALWEHIQALFAQDGEFVKEAEKAINQFVFGDLVDD